MPTAPNYPPSSIVETHLSTLFLAGDRVFKLLKPVDLGFVDHRTSEARIAAVTREHERNEIYSPDTYLGLLPVIEHGQQTDAMLIMRRLDSDRNVTAMANAQVLNDDHLRAIARRIAAMHASAEHTSERTSDEEIERHRSLWKSNLDVLGDFAGSLLQTDTHRRIQALSAAWVDAHESLLTDRVERGLVRFTHGDLLADDIYCLGDDGTDIELLDCLAFDDELSTIDVLDDLALLAMDLERLAGPQWARRLIEHYREFSYETHPSSLAHYYLAYRAGVRCKVACLSYSQGDFAKGTEARFYQQLMLDHLERARLRLILVGGGPGTGKSTVSTDLAERIGAVVLGSDDLRKDLTGTERTAHDFAELDAGIYSDEQTAETYQTLVEQARTLLAAGESVVLDASWTHEQYRVLAHELADEIGADFIAIECLLPIGAAKERIARRLADGINSSDATPEVAEALNERRDPWPEAFHVRTDLPRNATCDRAVHVVLSNGSRAQQPHILSQTEIYVLSQGATP